MNKNSRILILLLVLTVTMLSVGCEMWKRGVKDIGSSIGGLDRTLKVYSYDGQLLNTYQGRFDIKEDSVGTKVKFDINGKRVMIYNAIVIVEEDGVNGQ